MEGVDAGIELALIAHDKKKDDMVRFCLEREALLQRFNLVGTGTTARIVAQATGLAVETDAVGALRRRRSGPNWPAARCTA